LFHIPSGIVINGRIHTQLVSQILILVIAAGDAKGAAAFIFTI